MDDCFITRLQAAELLGISPRSFDNIKPTLIAVCGLKETAVGKRRRYLKSSTEWVASEYLSKDQTAAVLGLSKRSFERFKSHYISNLGLKEVSIGGRKFYTRTSIKRIIKNAIENDKDLGV
ncbi:MAG: hypothetical protein JW912_01820 [Sedimentisphaerales bacterium]|nr:hypothetical protein [Sedimentisphaerales bacterium]